MLLVLALHNPTQRLTPLPLFPPPFPQILGLFPPNLLPSDTLTGGQFFAALRLVFGRIRGLTRHSHSFPWQVCRSRVYDYFALLMFFYHLALFVLFSCQTSLAAKSDPVLR